MVRGMDFNKMREPLEERRKSAGNSNNASVDLGNQEVIDYFAASSFSKRQKAVTGGHGGNGK